VISINCLEYSTSGCSINNITGIGSGNTNYSCNIMLQQIEVICIGGGLL